MEHVVSLAVPLTVGTGYGKSWYEALMLEYKDVVGNVGRANRFSYNG